MQLQNRFQTGLDIARYTAKIMRDDMAAYDANPAQYTQSLGCWHGFIAQQKMISIKKHFGTTKKRYLYLSGWMIAALRSEFGPLPDQSMHEKTSVPALIEELYTFLRQADSRELNILFRDLDDARSQNDAAREAATMAKIENHETHVVPIIADIDAGFALCRSKIKFPTKSNAATKTAKSPCHMKIFCRKFVLAAMRFLNLAFQTASS